MIKSFYELTNPEKENVIQFMQRKNPTLALDNIIKKLSNEENNNGAGALALFDQKEVIAMIFVVLRECQFKGIAYIYGLTLLDGISDEVVEEIADRLLDAAVELSNCHGSSEIYHGITDQKILEIFKSKGIANWYTAVEMILSDRRPRAKMFDLDPLSKRNTDEYLEVYNDAFRRVPNGATLTKSEAMEYIERAGDEFGCFLVKHEGKSIGFLQISIEAGKGEFDIGLIEKARGIGFGTRLLETAIGILNSRNVDILKLTVITKNKIAYDWYQRRGFQESKLLSHWYQQK